MLFQEWSVLQTLPSPSESCTFPFVTWRWRNESRRIWCEGRNHETDDKSGQRVEIRAGKSCLTVWIGWCIAHFWASNGQPNNIYQRLCVSDQVTGLMNTYSWKATQLLNYFWTEDTKKVHHSGKCRVEGLCVGIGRLAFSLDLNWIWTEVSWVTLYIFWLTYKNSCYR